MPLFKSNLDPEFARAQMAEISKRIEDFLKRNPLFAEPIKNLKEALTVHPEITTKYSNSEDYAQFAISELLGFTDEYEIGALFSGQQIKKVQEILPRKLPLDLQIAIIHIQNRKKDDSVKTLEDFLQKDPISEKIVHELQKYLVADIALSWFLGSRNEYEIKADNFFSSAELTDLRTTFPLQFKSGRRLLITQIQNLLKKDLQTIDKFLESNLSYRNTINQLKIALIENEIIQSKSSKAQNIITKLLDFPSEDVAQKYFYSQEVKTLREIFPKKLPPQLMQVIEVMKDFIETNAPDVDHIAERLGTCYQNNFVTAPNFNSEKTAIMLFSVSNNPNGKYKLVMSYLKDASSEALGVELLHKLAKPRNQIWGNLNAVVEIGKIYLEGIHGVEKNYRLAADCFQYAANKGHAQGQYLFGAMLLKDKTLVPAQDFSVFTGTVSDRANSYLISSMNQGNIAAQQIILESRKTAKIQKKIETFLEEVSANLNASEDINRKLVSKFYHEVEVLGSKEAFKCFEKFAELNECGELQYLLAHELIEKNDEKYHELIINLLTGAVRNLHGEALYELGLRYLTGEMVEQDVIFGEELLKKMTSFPRFAQSKFDFALNKVFGVIHNEVLVIEEDHTLALLLLCQAANLDHLEAIHALEGQPISTAESELIRKLGEPNSEGIPAKTSIVSMDDLLEIFVTFYSQGDSKTIIKNPDLDFLKTLLLPSFEKLKENDLNELETLVLKLEESDSFRKIISSIISDVRKTQTQESPANRTRTTYYQKLEKENPQQL